MAVIAGLEDRIDVLEASPGGSGITACTTPTVEDAVATWCDVAGDQIKSSGVLADSAGRLGLGNDAYVDSMAVIQIDDESVDADEYYGIYNYTLFTNSIDSYNYCGQLTYASAVYCDNKIDYITGEQVTVLGSDDDVIQLVGVIAQVVARDDVTDYVASIVTYASGPTKSLRNTPKLYSLLITSPINVSSGKVDECYGIYIEDQGKGATSSYSLYAAGDGKFHIEGLAAYANNAAAKAAGLVAGDLYRTSADPSVVCVVT